MLDTILSDQKLLLIAAGFMLFIALFIGCTFGALAQRLHDASGLRKQRADAVRKSRAVLGGQFGEQLAPYFPGFPCNPGDAQFLGKPVDFIAFPGSAEGKPVKEVLFIEVKSGMSQLSQREKEIRAAIRAGRVRYVEYRLPDFDR